jgi:hypothetical protein
VIDRSRDDSDRIDIVARAQLAVVLMDVRNPVLLRQSIRPRPASGNRHDFRPWMRLQFRDMAYIGEGARADDAAP